MFFKIEGINNIEESNDFLINFSEKLREVFGKCSWAYFPAKNGPKQEITLGKIKINSYYSGVDTFIIFKIRYLKKGVINEIVLERYIESTEIEINSFDTEKMKVAEFDKDTINKIERCIAAAINDEASEYTYKFLIKSIAPFGKLEDKHFKIYPMSCKVENYEISCFEVQGKAITELAFQKKIEKKLKYICDVISIDVNLPVIRYIDESNQEINESTTTNYFRTKNYLEGVSLHKGYVVISPQTLKLINFIISPQFPIDDFSRLNKEISQYVKGGAHYNRALVHDSHIEDKINYLEVKSLLPGLQVRNTIFNGINVNNEEQQLLIYNKSEVFNTTQEYEREISLSFYLSAIEVVSDSNNEKGTTCYECGQKQFSIKKRVVSFIERYLDHDIAKAFSNTYDVRSQFLHTGKKNSDNITTRVIPQLSPNSVNGTSLHENGLTPNMIKEFTGFALREHLISIEKNI